MSFLRLLLAAMDLKRKPMKQRVSSVGKRTVPHFAGRRHCMIAIINSSFLESERPIPEIQENKIRISGWGVGVVNGPFGGLFWSWLSRLICPFVS